MLKHIKTAAAILLVALFSISSAMPVAAATPVDIYTGAWSYRTYTYAPDDLVLSDNVGVGLYMQATGLACGPKGASPSRMRAILNNNHQQKIVWWIDRACDEGFVRVCIQNIYNQSACSTYRFIRLGPFMPF